MLAKLDRRTKEARLLEASRASLTRHVGGAPNDIQRVLIERASRLMVYIETMDAQALEDGTMSERNSRGIVTGTCFYLLLLTHEWKPHTVIPIA
jgi:hypothetical protein